MIKHRSLALSAFGLALCAAAAPALAGDGTNLYSMIPQDTQIMVVFDVADARDSTLLQKGFDKLLAMSPDAKTKMAEIGINPMKDLDTIAFAAGGVKDFEDMDKAGSMVVIVEGRLPKDKMDTMPGATKSTYKGVTIYTKDDSDIALVGDRLFVTKKGKMKPQVDLAQGKARGKSLLVSGKGKNMRAALAATDTTADFWVSVLVPDKTKKDMAKEGMTANSVSVGANFTADLAMAARVESKNEESAKKMVALVQGQLAQATGMMQQFGLAKAAKSITVSQDKASVRMGITMTEAEIMAIVNMAQSFAGGGGGGMGGTP